jgi:hypothetical protein
VSLILAHGIGGRSDLPVPLWLALYGGAAAVIVSFAALGAFWREPRLVGPAAGITLPEGFRRAVDARVTRALLRGLGLLLFGATVTAAALGAPDSVGNPAPTWLYVWFWVGLLPASMLVGRLWKVMNPLRSIAAGIFLLSGDPSQRSARPLPNGLGYWPAAAGLALFTWIELVYDRADEPLTVVVFVSAYSLAQLIAAVRFGESWFGRGDAFEVYSTLVGSLAPIGRRSDGALVVRNPFDGLVAIDRAPGLLAVVCVLLGSTAFDGLTRSQLWADLTLGRSVVAGTVIGSAGLGLAIGFVAFTYRGAMWVAARRVARGSRYTSDDLGRHFAHSLIPIAIGYTVAHYFSLFVFQGQAGYILASDPLGDGLNLFGTATWQIDYTVVSTRAIALVQVGAIVAGHVAGVIAAHDRAVGLFSGADKTRGQYPLLAVMVAYTVGGIALLVGT